MPNTLNSGEILTNVADAYISGLSPNRSADQGRLSAVEPTSSSSTQSRLSASSRVPRLSLRSFFNSAAQSERRTIRTQNEVLSRALTEAKNGLASEIRNIDLQLKRDQSLLSEIDGVAPTALGDQVIFAALSQEDVLDGLMQLESKVTALDLLSATFSDGIRTIDSNVSSLEHHFRDYLSQPSREQAKNVNSAVRDLTAEINQANLFKGELIDCSIADYVAIVKLAIEPTHQELKSQTLTSPVFVQMRELEAGEFKGWSSLPQGESQYITEGDACPLTLSEWKGDDDDQIEEPVFINGQAGIFELSELLKVYVAKPINPMCVNHDQMFTLDQLVRPD